MHVLVDILKKRERFVKYQESPLWCFDKNIRESFADFFGVEDVTDVLVTIADNLNLGNIKFVVLMDKLHNRLKDLRIILKKMRLWINK